MHHKIPKMGSRKIGKASSGENGGDWNPTEEAAGSSNFVAALKMHRR